MKWILILNLVFLCACGSQPIETPFPEAGHPNLRVVFLQDPALPTLTDLEIQKILDLAQARLQTLLSRPIGLTFIGRADPDSFFFQLQRPLDSVNVEPRLNPTLPLTPELRSLLYGRTLELLRIGQLRPLVPFFSTDTNTPVSQLLDIVVDRFDQRLARLRNLKSSAGTPLLSPEKRNRRSVLAWHTVLGNVPQDLKPADVILMNDLLVFDSLQSLPPAALTTAGVTPAYTRTYPGMTLLSTYPFLSDDPFFAEMRGGAGSERRLELIAAVLTREIGNKLFLMIEDDFHGPECVASPWVPPFNSPAAGLCALKHNPLPRQRMYVDYVSWQARMEILKGNTMRARALIERLKKMDSAESLTQDLETLLATIDKSQTERPSR